ncbi:hypothetical protein [Sinorhizobium psoraleae]
MALCTGTALLSACVAPETMLRGVGGNPVAALPLEPVGVAGEWLDPNGFVSSFSGGEFKTRTTDTNQVLAYGTYVSSTPHLIEIRMTSLLRNRTTRVNCALVGPSQLNCTAESGSRFTLQRRAAVSDSGTANAIVGPG